MSQKTSVIVTVVPAMASISSASTLVSLPASVQTVGSSVSVLPQDANKMATQPKDIIELEKEKFIRKIVICFY